MPMVAQDTFVAELDTGPLFVQKGAVFADKHEVVKLDKGRGLLFKPLDLGDEDEPKAKPRSSRTKAAAEPAPEAGER